MPNADHAALLAAVKDRPHDETPKLVLADWYDDQGMSSHAEVWRHFGGQTGVREKAYTASEKALAHSSQHQEGEVEDFLSATNMSKLPHHDPETTARYHLSLAYQHDDLRGAHAEQSDNSVAHSAGAGLHGVASSLHLAAAHALSPGLKAHAATEAATNLSHGIQSEDLNTAERSANLAIRQLKVYPQIQVRDRVYRHTVAAEAHTRLNAEMEVRGRPLQAKAHAEAAQLHREAAAHYAALQGL